MLEVLIIIAVVLLLFGGSRLPRVGRSIGEAIRGFKGALGGTKPESPKEEIRDQRE